MTERLFLRDAYQQTATARVLAAGADGVLLDRTIFYARSGGQPGDVGTLAWPGGGCAVTDTIKAEGEAIAHLPAADAALPPADTEVELALDWPRRHRLMRMHTLLHLLCSLLPGAGVTGGQIGADRSRLDLDLPAAPDRAALEDGLNALVAASHPVGAAWMDEAVLDANPDLVRTLSVKPPRGSGQVRLVRIGAGDPAIDLQPCGGTHVATTDEIGPVVVQKVENKGRQNRRIVVALA